MFCKIVGVGSWAAMDVAPVQVVKVAHGGLGPHDRQQLLVKRAMAREFAEQLSRTPLRPGDIPVHIVALGATEFYGPNRNGDGFKEAWCRQHHDSFVKHAKYYRNHRNKDASKRYGQIIKSAYNEPMRRVELLAIANGSEKSAERNGGLVLPQASIDALLSEKPVEYSMACITDPATPVLTSRGYLPIVDVKVGDKVLTHLGRWRTVTELRRRRYTGDVVSWKVQGLPERIELTADHPMLGAKLTTKAMAAVSRSAFEEWQAKPLNSQFEWASAGDFNPSDRLRACIADSAVPGVAVLDNEELAEILGTYMAEGSIRYNGEKPSTLEFTTHGDDWATHCVAEVINHHWPDVAVTIKPKLNSAVAFSMQFCSTALATYCSKLIGTGGHSKRVPLGLYGARDTVKLAFLGRWIDGDGWTDAGGAHISSCNLLALYGARDLLLSIGLACVIGRIKHSKNNGSYADGVEYVLSICPADAGALAKYSQKCGNSEKRWQHSLAGTRRGVCVRYGSRTIAWSGREASYRLRAVERRYVADIQTYNFEVADDHSYSLAGLASHNCSISHDECANCCKRARSRAEYCEESECVNPNTGYRGFGCRSGLTKTANDGYQQYVDNPNPKWFDISEVPVHADRIAFGGLAAYLKQADALNVQGGAELAEQFMQPDSDALSQQLHVLPKLAAYEQALRSRPLTAQEAGLLQGVGQLCVANLAGAVKFAGLQFTPALSVLQQSRTLLSARDFFAWAAGGDAEKSAGIRDALDAVPQAFSQLLFSADMDDALERNPYLVSRASVKLAHLPKVPLTLTNVKRAAQLSVLLAPTRFNPGARDTSAAAEGLARQYALYKLATLSACVADDDFPTLCQLAVLQNFAV